MVILQKALSEMDIGERIGADNDGYPWILGYRGPALSQLMSAQVTLLNGCIEDLMMIKSAAKAALIRDSCKWGNLAHHLLQRYTQVGATETEVSLRASMEATLALNTTLGPLYRGLSFWSDGAITGAQAPARRSRLTSAAECRASEVSARARDGDGDMPR
jgi:hypothetical protein